MARRSAKPDLAVVMSDIADDELDFFEPPIPPDRLMDKIQELEGSAVEHQEKADEARHVLLPLARHAIKLQAAAVDKAHRELRYRERALDRREQELIQREREVDTKLGGLKAALGIAGE